jgi:hypothetical protein
MVPKNKFVWTHQRHKQKKQINDKDKNIEMQTMGLELRTSKVKSIVLYQLG